MNQRKYKLIVLCCSFSWQVLGLRTTPVRLACRTTQKVEDLRLEVCLIGKLPVTLSWAAAPNGDRESQKLG